MKLLRPVLVSIAVFVGVTALQANSAGASVPVAGGIRYEKATHDSTRGVSAEKENGDFESVPNGCVIP
jgi:hypothetical protein